MKVGKQQRDYLAVQKYLEKHPGSTARAAIAHVANAHGKKFTTVQVAYYRLLKANTGGVIAPPKPKKTTTKATPKPSNLDINVIRASLQDALRTIDLLEQENKKNAEIVNGLRKALTV